MNSTLLRGLPGVFALAIVGMALTASAADYVSVVTNIPNLIAYWHFDPVNQTNSLVNGYTGTLKNTAQIGGPSSGYPLPSDPTNQALILDGTNGYFLTTMTGQITNQGSTALWVYLTAEPSALGHIVELTAQSQSGNDFDFQIETDNAIRFFTDGGSSTSYLPGVPVNQWHFLAATFIANSTRVIYLDGVPVATSTAGGHSVNSNPLSVGENLVFTGRHFAGSISDVAVFSRALAANEIAQMFTAGAPAYLTIQPQAASVVVSWPTNAAGAVLQTNNSLTNPGGWGIASNGYILSGTNFVITNSVSPGNLFYRLAQ